MTWPKHGETNHNHDVINQTPHLKFLYFRKYKTFRVLGGFEQLKLNLLLSYQIFYERANNTFGSF